MLTEIELKQMLHIAIGGLVENEICSYCAINHDKDHRCKGGDYCENFIFEGLKRLACEYDPMQKENDLKEAECMAQMYAELI
jgi:Co/Zn/Cd efflux system component